VPGEVLLTLATALYPPEAIHTAAERCRTVCTVRSRERGATTDVRLKALSDAPPHFVHEFLNAALRAAAAPYLPDVP
jgi:hypothetical protein